MNASPWIGFFFATIHSTDCNYFSTIHNGLQVFLKGGLKIFQVLMILLKDLIKVDLWI